MIRDLIQDRDWMVKMDLKDAYFVLQEDRRWLRFRWEKGDLRVHRSPVWPISCSQGVHQNNVTSYGLDDNIHRQQFAASSIKGGSPGAGQSDGGLIRGPGVLCELQEVCVGPPAINGVSGVLDRFQINDRHTPSGEIGQNSQSGKEPAGTDIHNGKGPSTIHWKSQLSNTSHPTSSSVLSGSAGSETCNRYTQTGPRLSHLFL